MTSQAKPGRLIVGGTAPAAGPSLRAIRQVGDMIGEFPPTRYYGSKRKLLPWIFDSLKTLRFDTVLDAFGGTGTVSQLFRVMRKDVTYHDAFNFNAQCARATLSDGIALSERQVVDFIEGLTPQRGTVSRHFEDVFFLDHENKWIDGYVLALSRSSFDETGKSLLLYLLYQACLKKRPFNLFHRSNLSIRTRQNVKRSFGNATTWAKPFREHVLQCYREMAPLMGWGLKGASIAPSGDVMSLPVGYDLVYLDPPYVSQSERINRDGYWRRYHFLEGLSKYEGWAERIDLDSPIRMAPPPLHFGEWSSRASSKEKLFELIDRHRQSTVVLSYVQDAYPSDVEIKEFFETKFKKVTLHLTAHSHALSGTKRRELLYIGRPE